MRSRTKNGLVGVVLGVIIGVIVANILYYGASMAGVEFLLIYPVAILGGAYACLKLEFPFDDSPFPTQELRRTGTRTGSKAADGGRDSARRDTTASARTKTEQRIHEEPTAKSAGHESGQTGRESTPGVASGGAARRERDATPNRPMGTTVEKQRKRSTFANASIGAAVTSISYLLGPLALIAPVFGGFVAGYLEKRGATGGMKAGALKGFIMVAPATVIALVASSLLVGIPVIGELLAGSFIIVVLVMVAHSVAIGWFGGLFGGIIAGDASTP